jgi:hypothetical protein
MDVGTECAEPLLGCNERLMVESINNFKRYFNEHIKEIHSWCGDEHD